MYKKHTQFSAASIRKFTLMALFPLMVAACKDSAENQSTTPVNEVATQKVEEKPAPPAADTTQKPEVLTDTLVRTEAVFVISKDGDDAEPKSGIAVKVDGKKVNIAHVAGEATLYEKSEYKEKGIPANALAACGAWWAGAGDYFYLIKDGEKVAVYQGWMEETQAGNDYHWKKVKVLP